MKVMIFGICGLMIVSVVLVGIAGMAPLPLAALAAALLCTAMMLFVLHSALQSWGADGSYVLKGKRLGLILGLTVLGLVFLVLNVTL